jgi:allantoin racemase
MPTALIINPNTSRAMSESIERTAEKIFQHHWSFRVINGLSGPESLESWRDYQFAGTAIMPLLQEHKDVDGIVLACFGDPGLFALKEISPVPVVGIAEASISLALLLGGKFGILAAMGRAVSLMDAMVRSYGVESRYAGTSPLNLRVLNIEEDHQCTMETLLKASQQLAERGADVLLLGCAGLTGYSNELATRLSQTIIDPIEAGCQMIKTVVEMGLGCSHRELYSRPAPQKMNSLDQMFAPNIVDYFKTWEED